jgi:hypothetical protein
METVVLWMMLGGGDFVPDKKFCEANWRAHDTAIRAINDASEALGGTFRHKHEAGLIELTRAKEFWWNLWWVDWEASSDWERIEGGKRAKDMIGAERFKAGDWPHLPEWAEKLIQK